MHENRACREGREEEEEGEEEQEDDDDDDEEAMVFFSIFFSRHGWESTRVIESRERRKGLQAFGELKGRSWLWRTVGFDREENGALGFYSHSFC